MAYIVMALYSSGSAAHGVVLDLSLLYRLCIYSILASPTACLLRGYRRVAFLTGKNIIYSYGLYRYGLYSYGFSNRNNYHIQL